MGLLDRPSLRTRVRVRLAASLPIEVTFQARVQLYSFDDDYVRRLREGDRWTEEHFLRYFNELLLIKLRSFVNSVCNNVLSESFRSREGREVAAGEQSDVADDALSAEDALVTGETKTQVLRVLDQLDSRDAKLLRSVFLEERDKDEICREYGVDRDYLRVLLHRAKEKFRSAFLRRAEVATMRPSETETGKPSLRR